MTQPVAGDVSDRIRIARVVCIFLMIYAHVNPATAEFSPAVHGLRIFDAVRFWLADGAARASVGLLSLISGYLAFGSFQGASYGVLLERRARSLLIPMAVWSTGFLAVTLLGDIVRPGYAAETFGGAVTPWRLPDLLFGVTAPPANLPLSFLRDVFVCVALTPPLLFVLRRARWVLLGVLLVLAVTHAPIRIVLSPSILFLYAAGLAMGQAGVKRVRIEPAWLAAGSIVFLALSVWLAWAELHLPLQPQARWAALIEPAFNLLRLPAAIVFWALAGWLLQSPARRFLEALEPYVFIAFCSHLIVTTLVWAVWKQSLGGYYSPAYPVFFFAAPVVCFAAAAAIAQAGRRAAPELFRHINGGRYVPIGPVPRANGAKTSATSS